MKKNKKKKKKKVRRREYNNYLSFLPGLSAGSLVRHSIGPCEGIAWNHSPVLFSLFFSMIAKDDPL